VHFGPGKDDNVKLIEIFWPADAVQRIENVSVDRYLAIKEN